MPGDVPFEITAQRPLTLHGGGWPHGGGPQVPIDVNLEIPCPMPRCGPRAPKPGCSKCAGVGYQLTANGRALVALLYLYRPGGLTS